METLVFSLPNSLTHFCSHSHFNSNTYTHTHAWFCFLKLESITVRVLLRSYIPSGTQQFDLEFGLWQDEWYGRCVGTLARDGTPHQGTDPFPSLLRLWYHHEGTCPETHFQLYQSSGLETGHVVGQTRKWGASGTNGRIGIGWGYHPRRIVDRSRCRFNWYHRNQLRTTPTTWVVLFQGLIQ